MDWSELQNWDEYSKLLAGLLAVTNPLGSLPMVLGLIENYSITEKKRIVFVAVITFIVTLFIFTYVGIYILELFGITIAALKIAGGIMFLFYALEMMDLIRLPHTLGSSKTTNSTSIGIVPIGIPRLAGPGAISTVIIFSDIHPTLSHQVLISGVILMVGLIVFVIYQLSLIMGQKLGETSTAIMNRVMGLLLATISIEFILDGIVAHFPQLISIH
jgi:multiple antibiotic resistance protein